MTQQHVAEGKIDVAIGDAPYRLGVPHEENVVDFYLALNGEKPRFRENWDRFASIEEYEEFCSAWIDDTMRCLDDRGSMFIQGVHTNIHIIGRLLQIKGIQINNDIAWIKRNSRPHICQRRLHHSNETIIWAVKNPKTYRLALQAASRSDGLLQRTRQADARCLGHSDASWQWASLAESPLNCMSVS